MSDESESRQRLLKVEAALAGQAGLRLVLAADQAEKAISGLLAEREVLLARLEGTAAIAQGDGAVAAAHGLAAGRGVIVQGDVVLHTVDESPKSRGTAVERYLRWVMAETGFLTLSGIDPTVLEQAGREARLSLSTVYTGLRTSTPRERAEVGPGGVMGRQPPLSV